MAADFLPDAARVNGMIPSPPTTADGWLDRWRSWLDLDAMPEGWNKNLWGEFYALMHRRRMYREYLAVLEASPSRAAQSARFLTQWIARNHVETQAIAIRRIAHRTADPRTVSLVKLLDEIASNPSVLGPPVSSEAKTDADLLDGAADQVSIFANKTVAHLDRDHAASAEGLDLEELDDVVDTVGQVWERWYVTITDSFAPAVEPDLPGDWAAVIRLRRRDPSVDRPASLAFRIFKEAGEQSAMNLATSAADLSEFGAAVGRLRGRTELRALADDLDDLAEEKGESAIAELANLLQHWPGG